MIFSAWAGRHIALFARNCHAKTSVLHESKWYQNLATRTEQISFVFKVRAAHQSDHKYDYGNNQNLWSCLIKDMPDRDTNH